MQNEEFRFTYSAREQEELKKIREKYQPREEDKLERLHRLDAGVTGRATAVSLVTGILGALVLGLGMSLVMTDLGDGLGLSEAVEMALGVIVGVAGLAMTGLAYPLYGHVLKRERQKAAPEILRLTEELMK